MSSNDTLPCSPGLRRPLRTEAEALADQIAQILAGKKYSAEFRSAILDDHADLIIRALRAYKGK